MAEKEKPKSTQLSKRNFPKCRTKTNEISLAIYIRQIYLKRKKKSIIISVLKNIQYNSRCWQEKHHVNCLKKSYGRVVHTVYEMYSKCSLNAFSSLFLQQVNFLYSYQIRSGFVDSQHIQHIQLSM